MLGGLSLAVSGYTEACRAPEPKAPDRGPPVTAKEPDKQDPDAGAPTPVAPPPQYGNRVVRKRSQSQSDARK
jgi:hypothetical protein